MRVIGREELHTFIGKHADSKGWIECWLAETKDAVWNTPQDIKDRYPVASFLPNNRIIFNVRGNKYRLACKIAYNTKSVKVDWIGTHAEYSKIDFK